MKTRKIKKVLGSLSVAELKTYLLMAMNKRLNKIDYRIESKRVREFVLYLSTKMQNVSCDHIDNMFPDALTPNEINSIKTELKAVWYTERDNDINYMSWYIIDDEEIVSLINAKLHSNE